MEIKIQNFRINLSNIPLILLKSYKLILAMVVACLVIAMIYCKLVPKQYTSDFLIIPPKLSDAGSGLSPAVSATMALAGMTQRGGSLDMTIALLNTREISILVKQYIRSDQKYKSLVLPYSTSFVPDLRSGFLDIAITSGSPEYSKDVANYYILALGKHISNIAINKALQRANFYTQQLELAKNNRDVAESKLTAFKSKFGMTAGSQDAIVTSMVTSLQAQYISQKTALDSMGAYLTPDNPDYKTAQANLDAIKQRIIDLNSKVAHRNDKNYVESDDFEELLAPNYTSEFEMLQDEYNLRSLIYSVLVKQYEANNLDLQSEQDPIAIDVMDPPNLPVSYSYPNVKRTLTLTLFASVIFSVLFILAINWKKFIHNDNV